MLPKFKAKGRVSFSMKVINPVYYRGHLLNLDLDVPPHCNELPVRTEDTGSCDGPSIT